MQYDILKEVIAKASECDKAYKCLTCDPNELCQIKFQSAVREVTFIECALHKDCPFVENFTAPIWPSATVLYAKTSIAAVMCSRNERRIIPKTEAPFFG